MEMKANLEFFCPHCGGGDLEMPEDIITIHEPDTDEFLGFGLDCPWCGEVLLTSEVIRREKILNAN